MIKTNLVLQQKLNEILQKIDASPFSTDQKDFLKKKIHLQLKKAVMSVMAERMPKTKTDYSQAVEMALTNPETMPKLLELIDEQLTQIDEIITRHLTKMV